VGPQGPRGLGLGFEIHRASGDTTIALPDDNRSVIYLLTPGKRDVKVTLPAAKDAQSRLITIRRMGNGRGEVVISSKNKEAIEGRASSITLDDKGPVLTFVTDGVEWIVLSWR
jgi:hypothetical protein